MTSREARDLAAIAALAVEAGELAEGTLDPEDVRSVRELLDATPLADLRLALERMVQAAKRLGHPRQGS